MEECIITVKGPANGGKYPDLRGNTTRPWHDTTRPISKFFKGMGAYAGEVGRHIAGCSKCDPNHYLRLAKDAPHCFRREVLARAVWNNPKTNRLLALQTILESRYAHRAFGMAEKVGVEDWYRVLRRVDTSHLNEFIYTRGTDRRTTRWVPRMDKLIDTLINPKEGVEFADGKKVERIPREIREVTARALFLRNLGSDLPEEVWDLDDYITVAEIHTA